MTENTVNQTCDVDMNNSGILFDNLTILRELGNIANLVRDDDFLEAVPKAKLKRVKWAPMFNCLKQGILDEMVQELNSMWEFENIPEKLATLEKQKEKFSNVDADKVQWRPQLADVKSQLRAQDAANLRKQKQLLETLAKEYDTKVNRLKKNLVARRGYLKALQLDLQKYQKKSDEVLTKLSGRLEGHGSMTHMILPSKTHIEDVKWAKDESDLDSEI